MTPPPPLRPTAPRASAPLPLATTGAKSAGGEPRALGAAEQASRVRLELAHGSSWIVACALDLVLTAALGAALSVVALRAQGVRSAVQPMIDFAHASPAPALLTLVGGPLCAAFLLHGVVVGFWGGTVGHRLTGHRVVLSTNGARLGFTRAAVRGFASAMGLFFLCAGPLWGLLVDRRRRGLGDIVARAVVVRSPGALR